MKILHTADWHIGQLFHEYDRMMEHQQFLNWLVETLQKEQIDVLLISGDVFDLSNPSAASIRMFYTFLNQAINTNPIVYARLCEAFGGGYTHANYTYAGDIIEGVDSWDFTSSYP